MSDPGRQAAMAAFGRLALLHFLALGRPLDVTRDQPDLADLLDAAEREGLLEIDVKRASYALSPKGRAQYERLMREAQELVLRYDIFADVEADPPRFDTGLGQDLRVAVLEHDGLDPFRARFLVGLNDGEWDELPDWPARIQSEAWYDEVFEPVETAPGAADVPDLARIIAAGRAAVRGDDALGA